VNILVTLIAMLLPALLAASHIPTVCHSELSAWIQSDRKLSIVDIQNPEMFRAHNYAHSLATGNNPAQIKKISSKLRPGSDKVIIVSANGGADAVNALELLVRGGVKRSRILLLEGGMEAAARKTVCDCCKPSTAPATGAAQ
jgi:rhodanese-related sulfurtransferase